MNKNCPNTRTSTYIDTKLEPVTKFGKRDKTTLKKVGNDAMPKNNDIIDIFPIYGEFAAIQKLDS